VTTAFRCCEHKSTTKHTEAGTSVQLVTTIELSNLLPLKNRQSEEDVQPEPLAAMPDSPTDHASSHAVIGERGLERERDLKIS